MSSRFVATLQPSTLDIAWLAGIFEGEGSAHNQKTSGHIYPIVQISQKEPWILHRISAFFGGSVNGPYVQHKEDGIASTYIYRWSTSGARARGILMTIYSLLSPHRQEQIRSLQFLEEKKKKE